MDQRKSEVKEKVKGNDVTRYLLNPREVLPAMPNVTAIDEQMQKIRHGNAVNLPDLSSAPRVKVFHDGELVAIYERVAGTLFRARTVLI